MRSSFAQAGARPKGARAGGSPRAVGAYLDRKRAPAEVNLSPIRHQLEGSAFPWVIQSVAGRGSWTVLLSSFGGGGERGAVRNILKDVTVPEPIESPKKGRFFRGQMGNRPGGALANPGAASAVDGSAGRVV
jgi:hypothetical protein